MMRLLSFVLFLLLSVAARSETYVVCVGISNYASPRVRNLRLPEKDAKDVAEFFKNGTPHVITVTGKYAVKSQILKCLKSQFSRAKEGDKIIFYFSGHGYPGGFCPYDMTRIEEGLTFQEVINIMAKSKASGKFIFADACNSGAIRSKGKRQTPPETGNILLFLSSRGNEYSMEIPTETNGFFTKYLLLGLRGKADTDVNRRITAKEIFDFVSRNVQSRTKNQQHPVMWGKFDDNLSIVEYKRK